MAGVKRKKKSKTFSLHVKCTRKEKKEVNNIKAPTTTTRTTIVCCVAIDMLFSSTALHVRYVPYGWRRCVSLPHTGILWILSYSPCWDTNDRGNWRNCQIKETKALWIRWQFLNGSESASARFPGTLVNNCPCLHIHLCRMTMHPLRRCPLFSPPSLLPAHPNCPRENKEFHFITRPKWAEGVPEEFAARWFVRPRPKTFRSNVCNFVYICSCRVAEPEVKEDGREELVERTNKLYTCTTSTGMVYQISIFTYHFIVRCLALHAACFL